MGLLEPPIRGTGCPGVPEAGPIEPAIGAATSEIRGVYLDAVRAADRGDFAALVELHARFAG